MIKKPLVSVVMSVFDTPDDWLVQSIESVLHQTYENLEFIIIDDCCKKSNKDILVSYKEIDDRIILLKNEKNLGLTKSLNIGLNVARGTFVARIDADDLALPDRIEKQIKCFEQNKDLVICGTNAWALNGIQKKPFDVPLGSSQSLKCMLCWKDVFVHPSVMLNLDVMRKENLYYDENFRTAQDYELWCRLSKYGDVMNLPERLCVYRVHEKQVSSKLSLMQASCRNKIILDNLNTVGVVCSEDRLNIFLTIMGYNEMVVKPYLIIKETFVLCCRTTCFYGIYSIFSIREFMRNAFGAIKHSICDGLFRFFQDR